MEELKRFEDELKNNEELKKKFDEAIRRIAGEGLAKSDGELMSMAAKELGFDISVSASEKAKAREEVAD
ncbi:MAG: hypothetical protein J6D53_10605, partial [Blautia sp.]|nr:hypothetical protein [Blautia sp.]